MKSFDECLDEAAKELGHNYDRLLTRPFSSTHDIIELGAKAYARECCKATLEKAAENAEIDSEIDHHGDVVFYTLKESITDESNIVIV